jgi:HAMP domain-containing protein
MDAQQTEKRKRGWRAIDPRTWLLTGKLTGLVSLLVMIIIVTLIFFAGQSLQDTLTEQIGDSLHREARVVSDLVAGYFDVRIGKMQGLAEVDLLKNSLAQQNASYSGTNAEILSEIQVLDAQWRAAGANDPLIMQVTTRDPEANPSAAQLSAFLDAFPFYTEVFVTDQYGATVAATGRLSDYYQADEAWWQESWNGGAGAVYISAPEFDESAGVTALLVAVPLVSDQTGEIVGILRSTLNVDDLFELVAEQSIGETGYAVLLDHSGLVLFDPRADSQSGAGALSTDLIGTFLDHNKSFVVAPDQTGSATIFGHAGVVGADTGQNLSALERQTSIGITELGWAIVLRQASQEAFAPVNTTLTTLIVAGLLISAVAVAVVYVFSRTMVRPVQALETVAQEIADGNLGADLPAAGSDEIGNLTASIGRMAAQLQETLAGLELSVVERTRALETAAEISRNISSVLDPEELVGTVISALQEEFDFYHVHVYTYSADKTKLKLIGGSGLVGQALLNARHELTTGQGLVGRAAQTREPVVVSDIRVEAGWLPNPLLPDTKSEVAVPIAIGTEVLGVIDVQHNEVGGLGPIEATLLSSIAGQMAVSLRNADLILETETRARRQAATNLISEKIQNTSDIDSALQVALRELGRTLGLDRGVVTLITSGKNSRVEAN